MELHSYHTITETNKNGTLKFVLENVTEAQPISVPVLVFYPNRESSHSYVKVSLSRSKCYTRAKIKMQTNVSFLDFLSALLHPIR